MHLLHPPLAHMQRAANGSRSNISQTCAGWRSLSTGILCLSCNAQLQSSKSQQLQVQKSWPVMSWLYMHVRRPMPCFHCAASAGTVQHLFGSAHVVRCGVGQVFVHSPLLMSDVHLCACAASQAVVTQEQLQQAIQSVKAESIAAAKEAAATTYAELDVQRSYKTATVIGKAILDSTPQSSGLFVRQWLARLDTQLLRNLIDDPEAEQSWTQLQQRKLAAEMSRSVLAEQHVQEFYEKLLERLHSLSNPHGVHVLRTSRSGFGRNKPDACVSMSLVKAVVALVYAIEVKSLLSNTTKRQEAASQCHERVGLILANQQERSLCYAVAGGADAVELWRYSGTRADGCSNLLLLSWDAESPGLQALVRLWSMSPQDLGYVPAMTPVVENSSARLLNVSLLTATSSVDVGLNPQPGTYVMQGEWKGSMVVAKTSRQVDAEVGVWNCQRRHALHKLAARLVHLLV